MLRCDVRVRELRETFDVFFVDLWGVVHDGDRVFDGVTNALAELHASGARVLFLSNSSRLGAALAGDLVRMGIARDHFDHVVSSGEVTREALIARDPAVFGGLRASPRALHVGNRDYVPWLFASDVALDFVEELDEVELVLATGTMPDERELAEVRDRLRPLAARRVPLVCTNPDRVVLTSRGFKVAPGAVAAAYAALGGPTFLYGKPHAPIYAEAARRANANGARVVGVGDMLETDVRGARGAGYAAALVVGTGVHTADVGSPASTDALARLFDRFGIVPDVVLPRFVW